MVVSKRHFQDPPSLPPPPLLHRCLSAGGGLVGASGGIGCGRLHPDPECLDVFTHAPPSLPKCYCTDLCEDRLEELVATCASGQLVADGCGACLVCARARGQTCGGSYNVLG